MRVVSWIEIAWLFITTLHWTVTSWSTLEACLRSVRWLKVRVDLNTLNHLEVSWSIEPIWNICIIKYFSSVINLNKLCSSQRLIAQLVEHSLSVMKDPGSNLGTDICSFHYWSVIWLTVKLMSLNGQLIYVNCWLMLEPIGWMTKTLNRTMYAERDHLKLY